MRIAQVAPLFERVPPALYGGTERVVSYLTEELVRLGHDVTLFASGDSQTRARLVSVWDRALRLDRRRPEGTSLHLLMVEQVFKRASAFDVVHFHIDAMRGALALLCPIDWPEPFGLAMIEALACGTPVIAFRRGSVREVLDDGVSGRIVADVAGAVAAVAAMPAWDRRRCRETFERRFTVQRMARGYCEAYEGLRRRAWRLSS